MKKRSRKSRKGSIVIIVGIIVLISVIGGYILLSEASPFASKYSLSVTVRDAYGAVDGAVVKIDGIGTYATDSTGSIEPVIMAKGTYSITVTEEEHGVKTVNIDLASDMNLIIEIDYAHQYLRITSPVDGGLIPSTDAEHDPVARLADIIIWVEGTYVPGRTKGTHIRTFIDEDSHSALTPATSIWNARVYIGHISEGGHTLYVQYVSGNNVIEQQSIEIIVPVEWHVYFSTVGLADTGDGISRNPPDAPYWLGMNPPFPGEVTRIVGEFYLDILGNEPCEVWVDLWKPSTNSWVVVEKILDTKSGWNAFDVGVDYITTGWWGLAGCHWWDDETRAYNKVTEFKGEVWMTAGTHYYNTASASILDWFNDQFFPDEDENMAGPTPSSSCDGCITTSIDPSDLYAGSTPIAWIICIAVSLILFIGVAIFLMRRR